MSDRLFAVIAVENTAFHFDKPYDYIIPSELAEEVQPGVRVLVEFGHAQRQGVVMKVCDSPEQPELSHKPILLVLDSEPIYNDEMIRLAVWLKEHTFCTFFDAFRAMIPAGIYYNIDPIFQAVLQPGEIVLSPNDRQVFDLLQTKPEGMNLKKICETLGLTVSRRVVDHLLKLGYLTESREIKRALSDASFRCVRMSCDYDESISLTAKQKSVVELLLQIGAGSVKEVCYFSGVGEGVIKTLEKKGIVDVFEEEYYRNPYQDRPRVKAKEIVLNSQQAQVYQGLLADYEAEESKTALLYGVTGSGKTGVYMQLIDRVLADGKDVIVMVPEISLTAQTIELFRSRYGEQIAVFHSGLSMGQRMDEYKRVSRKEAKIVIGTRSAIFAPIENIGLIVIDEEQEHTYKSESTPRYHARNVAKFRAKYHKALLLLVSATPSVETMAAAKNGRYSLHVLKQRYGNAVLPQVEVVDMNRNVSQGNVTVLSDRLFALMQKTLEKKQQIILLLNRRGYHTFVSCRKCGNVMLCPNCSISMTYHSANNRLMCHYCGYSTPHRSVCPECGSETVRYAGAGTQKAAEELQALFPKAGILRIDADSTMTKFAHEKLLGEFSSGKYDILIGTQMVAKGLDFPNVTLVGVLNADGVMYTGDYNGYEKAFDLLTQVVGRSGRGNEKGCAVIQTYSPDNAIIEMAKRQDVDAFYESEIAERKLMIYPPFCDLCMIGIISVSEQSAQRSAHAVAQRIKQMIDSQYQDQKVILLGPSNALIKKVSNKYRYRILLKCRSTARLRAMIAQVLTECGGDKSFRNVTVYADMNPQNIL